MLRTPLPPRRNKTQTFHNVASLFRPKNKTKTRKTNRFDVILFFFLSFGTQGGKYIIKKENIGVFVHASLRIFSSEKTAFLTELYEMSALRESSLTVIFTSSP